MSKKLNNKSTIEQSLIVWGFYFLVSFLFLDRLWNHYFHFQSFQAPVKLVEILFWIPQQFIGPFYHLINFLLVLTIIGSFFWVTKKFYRIIVFMAILLSVAFDSSYGKVIHGYYGILFVALTFVFLPISHLNRFKFSFHILDHTQFEKVMIVAFLNAVICYGMAGIWKLRQMPIAFQNEGWNGLLQSLGSSIAYEHAIHSYEVSYFSLFFIQNDDLTFILFIGLVFLQVLSPVIVYFKKYHLFLGTMIFLFHLGSELILNISFRQQTYLIFLFFIVGPLASLLTKKKIAI